MTTYCYGWLANALCPDAHNKTKRRSHSLSSCCHSPLQSPAGETVPHGRVYFRCPVQIAQLRKLWLRIESQFFNPIHSLSLSKHRPNHNDAEFLSASYIPLFLTFLMLPWHAVGRLTIDFHGAEPP